MGQATALPRVHLTSVGQGKEGHCGHGQHRMESNDMQVICSEPNSLIGAFCFSLHGEIVL